MSETVISGEDQPPLFHLGSTLEAPRYRHEVLPNQDLFVMTITNPIIKRFSESDGSSQILNPTDGYVPESINISACDSGF